MYFTHRDLHSFPTRRSSDLIVRREAAVRFVEFRLENYIGLYVAEERQDPEVSTCLGIGTFENNELSVSRPIRTVGHDVGLEQQLLIPRPAGNFAVEAAHAASLSIKDNRTPIGRPRRVII